jgi:hypothetical protein
MDTLTFRIQGVAPLLMHSGQLADPLNDWARRMKKVSGKRQKTEADHQELGRLEYLGSLYLLNGEPCIPAHVLEASLIAAAKKRREGPLAKSGMFCADDFPLLYDGPHRPEDLCRDPEFRLVIGVVVQRNRVMRTRPMFREWAADVSIGFLPDVADPAQIRQWLISAGETVGLMDWRPRFGRFAVVE